MCSLTTVQDNIYKTLGLEPEVVSDAGVDRVKFEAKSLIIYMRTIQRAANEKTAGDRANEVEIKNRIALLRN